MAEIIRAATIGNINEHGDLVTGFHRFPRRLVNGQAWDFAHLEAFVMKIPVALSAGDTMDLDVVVLFSNHCFTRKLSEHENLPSEWIYRDDREVRALDEVRYALSRQYLRTMVQQLPKRQIWIADASRPNYLTLELPHNSDKKPQEYAVFFEVQRDWKRKRRVVLRVQSAYLLEQKSRRLQQGGKINFSVLLRRAWLKGTSH